MAVKSFALLVLKEAEKILEFKTEKLEDLCVFDIQVGQFWTLMLKGGCSKIYLIP